VLFGGRPFPLDEEYIAGWFSFFPATSLTPYSGIMSVPPASYVLVSHKRAVCQEYWKFDPAHSVRYATDEEYEEHFRNVFSASIRRRLRADAPVTAELSGGMDSSSIVCLADDLIAHSESNYPRLDTVSYYDDADANWDERPFFSAVEERRGRAGCHLSVDVSSVGAIPRNPLEFRATPASSCPSSSQATRFTEYFAERRSRVLLSGVGGDEVLGGVPTPIPELADLLAFGKLLAFARRTTEWALAIKKPWIFLTLETARRFLPPGVRKLPSAQTPPQWLKKEFVERQRDALNGYERRLMFSGVRPSFQVNMSLLEGLRRQIACIPICCQPLLDTRYPYLDRELLQFLYATPREQMVRPHQRRSLMRRALTQTVPSLVLNRRRKAAASRSPLAAIAAQCGSLLTENPHWESARLGIVDQNAFLVSVQKALSGENLPLFQLIRTLMLESWLRGLTNGPRPIVLTFPPGRTSTIRKMGSNAGLGGRDELREPASSALRRRGLLHFLS
jgi:asparagine synthase (glutamine-hydrolysing)